MNLKLRKAILKKSMLQHKHNKVRHSKGKEAFTVQRNWVTSLTRISTKNSFQHRCKADESQKSSFWKLLLLSKHVS